MTNNTFWGPITWTFFHTFIEKIKDTEYDKEKEKLLGFFKKICSNLPCPDCTAHALSYIKDLQLKHITKKNDFKKVIFNFHNLVNVKLGKKKEKIEILENYKSVNTLKVFYEFISIFSKPVHNNRLMMESLNRNFLMKELTEYLRKNINKFN